MWSECIPAPTSLTSIVKFEHVWNVLDLQDGSPQDSDISTCVCAQALWWEDWGGHCWQQRSMTGSLWVTSQPPPSDATRQAPRPALHREEAGLQQKSCEDGYSRQMWLPAAAPAWLPFGENAMISLSLLFLRGL